MPSLATLFRRLGKARQLDRAELQDLYRASNELWRARKQVASASVPEILACCPVDPAKQAQHTDRSAEETVERVSIAIQRAANVVPWRSDCLIQAEAARHWLAAEGIETRIELGSHRTDAEGFLAHAWLIWRDRIVTGGDISRFSPFE
ncbi:lasso peptide biosynthesis B2 protein [Aliiruegeria lutimaris]|uniref:Transglutaminase-like superfamily protein n=1 Tax=Aliiruegeria lutimaris TaxID=571298 RepID=A0A1G8Q6D7_9RHOB|nr:lasso peptide biosynthesis B2 protein [Aliiruegeria lutimaris]SDJ00322.1 Transglutaminase-like superfamily protein [Aliiruegeria lutimaris]